MGAGVDLLPFFVSGFRLQWDCDENSVPIRAIRGDKNLRGSRGSARIKKNSAFSPVLEARNPNNPT